MRPFRLLRLLLAAMDISCKDSDTQRNLLSCALVFSALVFASCTNGNRSSSNDSTSYVEIDLNTEQSSRVSEIDVPISISLTHPDDLEFGDPMRYKSSEQDKFISIFPSSRNYDAFHSGKRYEIPMEVCLGETEDVEYLSLDAIIANTTESPLSISRLMLQVEESEIDNEPYLYISTMENYSNALIIYDEGWTDYGDLVFEYTLLKKGENFDGKYNRKKDFRRPKDYIVVDFLPDLIAMGYNWSSLSEHYHDEDQILSALPAEPGIDPGAAYYPFEWTYNNSEWEQNYEGFCRIYGKITFPSKNKSIEFQGKISLSTGGEFGAYLDYNDHFDYNLKVNGQDYEISKPYITTIAPNDVERIGLKIKCDKSSNHTFRLLAINDNGLVVSSKYVKLHYMFPRHCVEASPKY